MAKLFVKLPASVYISRKVTLKEFSINTALGVLNLCLWMCKHIHTDTHIDPDVCKCTLSLFLLISVFPFLLMPFIMEKNSYSNSKVDREGTNKT